MIDFIIISIVSLIALMLAFPVVITILLKAKDTKWENLANIVFKLPFAISNWLFNTLILSVWCWDLPEKIFFEGVTDRMKRYKRTESGRKLRFATWVCNYLNKSDPGHC